MWYKIDIKRFGWQMLPPILRGKTLGALLMVLLTPLVSLYDRFVALRQRQRLRLEGNGQVIAMRRAIIKRYNLHEEDVDIVDAEDREVFLYWQSEAAPPTYLTAEAGATIKRTEEGRGEADYIVFVPDFLEGRDRELKGLLNHYRPAGRKYELKYYTYG